MKRRLCLTVLCGAVLATRADPSSAQERARFPRQLTSVHWEHVPLGQALERLSRELGRPIFADRRVDSNQRINLDIADASGDEVLEKTAAAVALGASRLDGLAYIGPPAAATQLRTLAAVRTGEISALPAALRDELMPKRSFEWPRLSEPGQLVSQLVEDRGWRLSGADRIPHDLWPAGGLPEMTFADQLTLLLIGFELTFSLDPNERRIEIVPIAGPLAIPRSYPRSAALNAARLKEQFPNIEAHESGGEVVVAGTVEDHERIRASLEGEGKPDEPPPPPVRTKKVYTLRVEQQPVNVVLGQLAERLGWTIEIDDGAIAAAGLSLDQRVSFSVENAGEDELLRSLLRPAGLIHRRDGNRIRIVPYVAQSK